jgi:predicted HAD superfamily phosphohydrolase YqeG
MLKIILAVLKNKPVFNPNYQLNSANEILNIPKLVNSDKKIYIFDKDDTLVPLHEFKVTCPLTTKLLVSLKEGGKKVYVVSNSVKNHGHYLTYLDGNNVEQAV